MESISLLDTFWEWLIYADLNSIKDYVGFDKEELDVLLLDLCPKKAVTFED